MSKAVKTAALSLLLVVIIGFSFGTGYFLNDVDRSASDEDLELLVQAWDTILTSYVDRDNLDTQALSQAAIEGMIESLPDPYSSYLDAEAFEVGMENLEGKIEGIGAEVTIRDEQIIIIAPLVDSPAAKGGIKPGDVILGIDGESTDGMSLAEAVLKIRGPKGTAVTLLIVHQGETEPEEIVIVRDEIELQSVYFEMRDSLAYIVITHFYEQTGEELSEVLEGIDEEATTGIILDLRGNPGGILEATVEVASHFLREGVVVNVMDSEGDMTAHIVKPTPLVTDLPLVVLVSGFTASGGEVLAGAIQDYDRGTIAGTRTYGKGSVNKVVPLKDGSGIFLTIAHWLTPDGHLIEGEGLHPDYELELSGEEAVDWAIDYLKSQ